MMPIIFIAAVVVIALLVTVLLAAARLRRQRRAHARRLAALERRLLAKDAIITDLFDHCDALNREIDLLRARVQTADSVKEIRTGTKG